MAEELIKAGFSGAEEASARLRNAVAQEYNTQVDAMFGRLHENLAKNEEAQNYDANDYKRVGFSSRQDAAAFATEMQKQGVDVSVAPVKLSGQYLVEIPKENTIPVFDENSDASKTRDISADKLIQQFEQKSFINVEEANSCQTTEPKSTVTSEVNSLGNYILSEMDDFGRTVSRINSALNELSPYNVDADNKRMFTQKLNGAGEANPVFRSRSQTAQVINGDTVVVNGHVVHDEKTRDYVLKQYNDRMEKAGKIVEKSEARLEKGKTESKKQAVMHQNAQKMLDGIYNQEVAAPDVETRAFRSGGELDNIVNSLNTDAVVMKTTATFKLSNDERAAIGRLGKMSSLTDAEKRLIAKVTNAPFGVKTETLTIAERETLSKLISKYTSQDSSKYGLKMRNLDKDRQARLREANEQTLPGLSSFQEKIKLSDAEKMMFSTHSSFTLKNLEKDFNIKITEDNPLTREGLLKMNAELIKRAEKAGIQFVQPNGKFDVNLLKKLSDKELAKLGISRSTRDQFVKLNAEGAWGQMQFDGSALRFGVKVVHKLANDKDTSDLINGVQKTCRYTSQAITSVRQFKSAAQGKIDALKAKSVGKKDGLANVKAGKPKPRKEPKVRPVNEKANAKFIKKQQKMGKKVGRSEKSVFTKARKFKNRFMKKIANNPLVKIVNSIKTKIMSAIATIIPYILLGILILWGGLVVIVVVCTVIESIANAVKGVIEFLTPDAVDNYFNQSASYSLVINLNKQEDEWIESLAPDKDAWDSRAEMYYGFDEQGIGAYFNNSEFDGVLVLGTDGKTVYINPFHSIDGLVTTDKNQGALTKKDGFDGRQDVIIDTNASVYTQITEGDAKTPPTFVESGHTSNVKDIVAMADVLYRFESDDAGDGHLESIMGESPASLNWKDFKNKWNGFWESIGHNIGTFFAKLFGSGDDWEYVEIGGTTGTVSYRTLQGYCAELFQASHQKYFYLGVSYHDVDDELAEAEVPDSVASELDKCSHPVTQRYELYFNDSRRVVPCLIDKDEEDEEGAAIYDLSKGKSEYDFDIDIDMGNFSDTDWNEKHPACLWESMASDKATYEAIKGRCCTEKADHTLVDKNKDCWTLRSQIHNEVTSSASSGWCDSESEAKSEVEEALTAAYNSAVLPEWSFTLSSDGNAFTCIRYERPVSFKIEYTVSEQEVEDGTETETVTNPDGTTSEQEVTKYKTQYSASGTAVMYIKFDEKFVRKCARFKHDFTYCGGHLDATSQGVVYSMTNEQLALCGTYNKLEEYPTILDYDYEANGYGKLVGKHYPKEADTSSALTYSMSGGSHDTAATNAQGSDASRRGMNINVDGTDITTGYDIQRLGEMKQQILDIFDADCLIDKGRNVFPTGQHYEKYEGWNEDNMTLALLRSTVDWISVYTTNTPTEIGTDSLSTVEVIPNIIKELKATYGDSFDAEREEIVRTALTWVGRGHYADGHDHDFLTELCSGNSRTLNCTASDSKGFVNFVLNRSAANILEDEEAERKAKFLEDGGEAEDFEEKTYTPNENILGNSWRSYGGINDLLPGDIIWHKAAPADSLDTEFIKEIAKTSDAVDTIRSMTEERYVIYVGKLQNSVSFVSAKDKVVEIPANTPLIIDLVRSANGIGTVRLRTVPQGKTVADDTIYSWVINPDAYTKVKR